MAQSFNFSTWNYKETKKSSNKTLELFRPPSIVSNTKVESKDNDMVINKTLVKDTNYTFKNNIKTNINKFHQETILKNQNIKKLITSIPSYKSLITLPLRNILTKSDISYQFFNEDVKIKNIIIKELQDYNITSNTNIIFFNKNIVKLDKVIGEFNESVNVDNIKINSPEFETLLGKTIIDYTKKDINKGKTIISDAISQVELGKTIVNEKNYPKLEYKSDVILPSFNVEKYQAPLDLMSKEVSVTKNTNILTEYQDIVSETSIEDGTGVDIKRDLKDSNVDYGPFPYLYTSAFSLLYGQILQRIPGITGLPGGGNIVNFLKDVGADQIGAKLRNVINRPIIKGLYFRNQLVKRLRDGGWKQSKLLFSRQFYKDTWVESMATFGSTWLVEKDINFEGSLFDIPSATLKETMESFYSFNLAQPPVKYGTSTSHRAGEPSHNIKGRSKWSLFYTISFNNLKGEDNIRFNKKSIIAKSLRHSNELNSNASTNADSNLSLNKFYQDNIFYGIDHYFMKPEFKEKYNTDFHSHLWLGDIVDEAPLPRPILMDIKNIFEEYQKNPQLIDFIIKGKESKVVLKLPESFEITHDKLSGSYAPIDFIGRHDPVYRYNKFTRNLSVKFDIIADVPKHNVVNHYIINELNKFVLPKYSGSRANVLELTIGDYMESQDCLLNDVNVSPIKELYWMTKFSSYEYSLPQGYTVSLSFIILDPGIDTTHNTIGSSSLRNEFQKINGNV